jgi:hypothetical protein
VKNGNSINRAGVHGHLPSGDYRLCCLEVSLMPKRTIMPEVCAMVKERLAGKRMRWFEFTEAINDCVRACGIVSSSSITDYRKAVMIQPFIGTEIVTQTVMRKDWRTGEEKPEEVTDEWYFIKCK